jgi:hypothetical protein
MDVRLSGKVILVSLLCENALSSIAVTLLPIGYVGKGAVNKRAAAYG